MNEHILKLSNVLVNHSNFSLNIKDLKIYPNIIHKSSYNKIKDLVSIIEDLDKIGIYHKVYDDYIQTLNIA